MVIKRIKETRNKSNRSKLIKYGKSTSKISDGISLNRPVEGRFHYRYGITDCLCDITVVIPSFQEDRSILDDLVSKLRANGAEVIVVDDGSLVDTYHDSIKHGSNFGYGSAIMTGIKNATRPYIMTLDGDGQHTIHDAIRLASAWKLFSVDMLIGARSLGKELWYRFLGRKFLNWTASMLCLYWLRDLNSGMRIFKKDIVTGYIPILCKNFSFTTSLTLSMLLDNYKVDWFPINVQDRSKGKSRVRVFKHGWITLYYILRISFALRTRGIREKWRRLKKYLLQAFQGSSVRT